MKIYRQYVYRDWLHSLGTRSAVKILKGFTTSVHVIRRNPNKKRRNLKKNRRNPNKERRNPNVKRRWSECVNVRGYNKLLLHRKDFVK